jgi:hypothetical protein
MKIELSSFCFKFVTILTQHFVRMVTNQGGNYEKNCCIDDGIATNHYTHWM